MLRDVDRVSDLHAEPERRLTIGRSVQFALGGSCALELPFPRLPSAAGATRACLTDLRVRTVMASCAASADRRFSLSTALVSSARRVEIVSERDSEYSSFRHLAGDWYVHCGEGTLARDSRIVCDLVPREEGRFAAA